MKQATNLVKKALLFLLIIASITAILPSATLAQTPPPTPPLAQTPAPALAQTSASALAQTPPPQTDKKAAKAAAIKDMVESQNYVFKAQTVLPMAGRTRQLTSDYDLKVTKETIISYLPYFGRAYAAPIDPSKGGIQFTSKDFDYTLTPGKKDGWNVLIKPKDYRDVQQMNLSISSAGYATLQVTSTNRQPISFTGQVVTPKQK